MKPIDSPGDHIIMKAALVEGDSNITGYAEVTIDTSIEESAAMEYMTFSRSSGKEFYQFYKGILLNIFQFGNHCHARHSVRNIGVPGFNN